MYISISIAIVLAFGLFRTFVPHEQSVYLDEEKLEQNKRKYATYEGLSIFPLFIFLGLIAFAVYELGIFTQSFNVKSESDLFYFGPGHFTWFIPGSLLAFGLVIIPMERLYKFLLKDEYDLYLEATNRRHGWDGMKVAQPICKILVALGLAAFVLLHNVSLRVSKNQLFISDFFDLSERVYELSDISEIVYYGHLTAPNGNIIEQEQYILYKSNEKIWSTNNSFLGNNNMDYLDMIYFIEDHNQIEVIERELYSDENH